MARVSGRWPGQLSRSPHYPIVSETKMIRFLSLLVLLLGVACTTISQSHAISADEYSVYSALINARFAKAGTDSALIQSHTGQHLIRAVTEFEKLLWAKNEKSFALERRFDIRVKYTLLDRRQLEQMFGKGVEEWDKSWMRYWKQHPHSTGLLTFSRVALNSDNTEAILSVSELCGGLCGYGYLFRLTKDKGTWKLVEESTLWVS